MLLERTEGVCGTHGKRHIVLVLLLNLCYVRCRNRWWSWGVIITHPRSCPMSSLLHYWCWANPRTNWRYDTLQQIMDAQVYLQLLLMDLSRSMTLYKCSSSFSSSSSSSSSSSPPSSSSSYYYYFLTWQEWQYVARHLLPTARRTIQERIEICDVKKVKIAHALRAKSLVGQYTELAITDVSAVAVPFFKWVRTKAGFITSS